MSHEFESSFFVRREAWHGLGTVLENPPSNAREAIKAAGLDWKVEKRPLYFKKGESKLVFPESVGRAFNVMMSTGKIIRDKAYETAVAISLSK